MALVLPPRQARRTRDGGHARWRKRRQGAAEEAGDGGCGARQAAEGWNRWRRENPDSRPDLRGVDLSRAHLRSADLRGAHLSGADLSDTHLSRADLSRARLRGARLGGAHLIGAHLIGADLKSTDLSRAILLETTFANTNLSDAIGLDSCNHSGPSPLDGRTLARSGPLPLAFLRGCGLSDWEIEAAKLHWPGLSDQEKVDIAYRIVDLTTGDAIQYASCFISYSSKDQHFTEKLYADLQAKGVRCWYAPQDLRIGDRFEDKIDQAVRLHDKLLIILSEESLKSEWVEDEVRAAVAEERRDGQRRTILFPVRIDNAIEEAEPAWARRIKESRHIGDFSNWQDPAAFEAAFQKLLRDLRADDAAGGA